MRASSLTGCTPRSQPWSPETARASPLHSHSRLVPHQLEPPLEPFLAGPPGPNTAAPRIGTLPQAVSHCVQRSPAMRPPARHPCPSAHVARRSGHLSSPSVTPVGLSTKKRGANRLLPRGNGESGPQSHLSAPQRSPAPAPPGRCTKPQHTARAARGSIRECPGIRRSVVGVPRCTTVYPDTVCQGVLGCTVAN
jgi:hypothetical protein